MRRKRAEPLVLPVRPNMEHEAELQAQGYARVAGIDEVGRGPLAGPVCAAAVILPADFSHPILTDSKKLSAAKREQLYAELTTSPLIQWGVVLVEVEEIDRINILQATHVAMKRALAALAPAAQAALIDGLPVPHFPVPQTALVKGDSRSFSIAAASVIAKVTRDRLMAELGRLHPEYGFEVHKGYPTPQHLTALRQHGPTVHHRFSFAPVAQMELSLKF
jgi:ribonuclease HII